MIPDDAAPPPVWVRTVDAGPLRFDVAALLDSGVDVFSTLTGAARALTPGHGLLVIAPFHPVPLRTLLAEDGLQSWADTDGDGQWQVRFWKPGKPAALAPPDPVTASGRAPRFWVDGDLLHLDVSALPPPRPMLEVLRFIDRTSPREDLMIHVPHIPTLLFDDLEDRGWSWTVMDDGPDPSPIRVLLHPPA